MRENTDGTSMFLWGVSAAVLAAAVLLSGCASKGARQKSSLYSQNLSIAGNRSRVAAVRPPAPVRAKRQGAVGVRAVVIAGWPFPWKVGARAGLSALTGISWRDVAAQP